MTESDWCHVCVKIDEMEDDEEENSFAAMAGYDRS